MCDRCSLLEAQLRSFTNENGQLHDDLSGLLDTTRAQGRSIVALKRELKKVRHEEPLANDIAGILRLWRALCSTRAASIDLDGDRAKVARAALKSHTTGTRKERRRICMDAVRGLALRPYVVNAQRTASGPREQRYADIEHAMGGKQAEKRIEEHAGFYRMAHAKPLDWKNAAWMAAIDVEARYRDLYMDEVYARSLERSKAKLRDDPAAVVALASRTGFSVAELNAAIARPQLVLLDGGELAA